MVKKKTADNYVSTSILSLYVRIQFCLLISIQYWFIQANALRGTQRQMYTHFPFFHTFFVRPLQSMKVKTIFKNNSKE